MYLCKKGFTLIELMVVVAIVGIMGALVIPAFHEAVVNEKAENAVEKGTKVSSIEDKEVRDRVIVLLRKKGIDAEKVKAAQDLQDNLITGNVNITTDNINDKDVKSVKVIVEEKVFQSRKEKEVPNGCEKVGRFIECVNEVVINGTPHKVVVSCDDNILNGKLECEVL